ncbi:MAG TPA: 2-hydroxyhepta-2,4-diene-1,7-dioate isomerase [Clostridiales bacterium]|nr:2-hydroxyhepta-2,4-diene-1,7-dioate isomerase [Clostridiales bacterium]
MRYVRFARDGQNFWGILVRDELIQPLTAAPYLHGVPKGPSVPLQAVHLLAPCEPGKIVAVGKNYHDHIQEFDSQVPENPILFIKPVTCVNDPEALIVLPPKTLSRQIDYEGELALVIGRTARNIPASQARHYIFGYTCLNDVTARDIQKKDGQWTRAKSFDGFAPVGPLLTDEVDPDNLTIRTRLNGHIVQQSSTSHLIWPVSDLLAFISETMTLLPGDIITTGTPSGVGPMEDGDLVEISIQGIGCLRNRAKASQ